VPQFPGALGVEAAANDQFDVGLPRPAFDDKIHLHAGG